MVMVGVIAKKTHLAEIALGGSRTVLNREITSIFGVGGALAVVKL